MTYEEAVINDVTVYNLLHQGEDLKEIIAKLATEKQIFMNRIEELKSITPRKIRHKGQVYIWHCPDDLIPIEDI